MSLLVRNVYAFSDSACEGAKNHEEQKLRKKETRLTGHSSPLF